MNLIETLWSFNPEWSQLEIMMITLLMAGAAIVTQRLLVHRKIHVSQAVGGIFLLIALLLIFGTTVLTRSSEPEAKWQLRLFWSWERALAGDRELLRENLLNLLLLLPVGLLLPVTLHKRLRWWQALCVGIVISATIELLQLFWHRGLFEFDDIIHNAMGCMAGGVLCSRFMQKST